MMKSLYKYIVIVLFSVCSQAGLSAQVKQSEHDPTFNALNYSLQKRYKPENENFVKERWIDNTFVSLYMGTSQVAGSNNIRYSWAGKFGFALGKWIDHANGLRLGLNGESFQRTSDGSTILSHGIEASYMLNLTSYMGGYRRSRFCELSMVTGLGFNLSSIGKTFKPAGDIHLGLNAAMRFSRTLEFFVEPMAYCHTGNFTHPGTSNWKKYNLAYGLNMGLNYSIVNPKAKREPLSYLEDCFIHLAVGAQFHNAPLVFETVGLRESIGPQCALAFGHWFEKWFALRGTAFHSYNTWCRYLDEYDFNTDYMGLRVEAMFDFLKMTKKEITHHSLSAVVGPEIGYMMKVDLFDTLNTPYMGLSAGINYTLKFCWYFGIFIEPRMSLVPYTHSGTSEGLVVQKKFNYFDFLVNMNAGLAISW